MCRDTTVGSDTLSGHIGFALAVLRLGSGRAAGLRWLFPLGPWFAPGQQEARFGEMAADTPATHGHGVFIW